MVLLIELLHRNILNGLGENHLKTFTHWIRLIRKKL